MKTIKLFWLAAIFMGMLTGCNLDLKAKAQKTNVPQDKKNAAKQEPQKKQPDPINDNGPKIPKIDSTKPLFKQKGKAPGANNVFIHFLPNGKKQVLINAYVCMQRGGLEVFLCRKESKEHEAILAAAVDARTIHTALNFAGAKEGSPVQFLPKYKSAHGSTIKVSVQYKDKKGKMVTLPAQKWIRNVQTKKEMQQDWVFAGSKLIQVEKNKPPIYSANDGTVICISNFDNAMLDLPIQVSDADNQLIFEAWEQRVPPEGTPVLVILDPLLMNQKK